MAKQANKNKPTTRKTTNRKKTTKTSRYGFLTNYSKRSMFIVFALIFAVIGSALVFMSNAATTNKFITQADVGPQASTYGHKPYGPLKKWTGGTTITESSGTRGADGWMRLQGYEFEGPLYIQAPKVALIDCKVTYTTKTVGTGTVAIKKTSGSPYLIDHCIIDQGPTGWSISGIDAYYPGTVRYSLVKGSGDGIKSGTNSLFEHNYLNISGQGTENSPGHVDGIQGEYFKFNWIARHNTIITGVHPSESALAAGAQDGPENGGNIGIWVPNTATGSAGPSGAEGVLVEDNYINGFNTGISIMGTNPSNPQMVRNNEIGPNLRYYPGLSIRTWSIGFGNQRADYVITQNNYGDRILDETTGVTSNYAGKVGKINDFIGAVYDGDPIPPPVPGSTTTTTTPAPVPPTPEPIPAPSPNDPAEPESIQATLPATYSFDVSTTDWVGQGNASFTHTTAQGQKKAGALVVKADASGQFPDNSKTIRIGTPQYTQGLTTTAGQNITASLAVKSASNQRNARCEIRFYNGGKILSTVSGTSTTTTTGWTTRTCSAIAPANTTNVGLRLFIEGAEYGEVFYLDDATISSANSVNPTPVPAPTPIPAPAPTPTPAPTPIPQPTLDIQKPTSPTNISRSLILNAARLRYDLQIKWNASSDNIGVDQYVVSRNGTVISKTTSTNYKDSSLKSGTLYNYRIEAQDAAGNTSDAATTSAKANCFLLWCSLE